jgi:hypothetical protein
VPLHPPPAHRAKRGRRGGRPKRCALHPRAGLRDRTHRARPGQGGSRPNLWGTSASSLTAALGNPPVDSRAGAGRGWRNGAGPAPAASIACHGTPI